MNLKVLKTRNQAHVEGVGISRSGGSNVKYQIFNLGHIREDDVVGVIRDQHFDRVIAVVAFDVVKHLQGIRASRGVIEDAGD